MDRFLILILLCASQAFAQGIETWRVCRVDASGVVVESVSCSGPTTSSVGVVGPGESVISVHSSEVPAGRIADRETHVPLWKVSDGKIVARSSDEIAQHTKLVKETEARVRCMEKIKKAHQELQALQAWQDDPTKAVDRSAALIAAQARWAEVISKENGK